ncbi:MAG TPA: ribosome biogenesis GTP-binding protein YihA/YsxC [Candidatus Cloacimonadota bacterium]|nr:ribosome biogenesis GTP-binding protein YihA/YsxC [Candidatus Cloacimonadota bacterium]
MNQKSRPSSTPVIRLVESFYVKSAVEPADYPASAYPEFAFAGKSNVGKSTLINLLTNHHGLAKTSSTPGKTRLLNFFLVRYKVDEQETQGFMQFTDLPGYGFAEVSLSEQEKWRKMVTKYLEQRSQLRSMILLADIRHPADKKDLLMLEMLRLRKIDHCIVATKSDKIPKTKIQKTAQVLAKDLGLGSVPIFPVSALNNTGFEPLLEWMYQRCQA